MAPSSCAAASCPPHPIVCAEKRAWGGLLGLKRRGVYEESWNNMSPEVLATYRMSLSELVEGAPVCEQVAKVSVLAQMA